MGELEPELTEEEFFDFCDDLVYTIVEKEEPHNIFDSVDPHEDIGHYSDWYYDVAQSGMIECEYILSAEEYLSDDYVTDWDILSQYETSESLAMTKNKASQKFRKYMKIQIGKEINSEVPRVR